MLGFDEVLGAEDSLGDELWLGADDTLGFDEALGAEDSLGDELWLGAGDFLPFFALGSFVDFLVGTGVGFASNRTAPLRT